MADKKIEFPVGTHKETPGRIVVFVQEGDVRAGVILIPSRDAGRTPAVVRHWNPWSPNQDKNLSLPYSEALREGHWSWPPRVPA